MSREVDDWNVDFLIIWYFVSQKLDVFFVKLEVDDWLCPSWCGVSKMNQPLQQTSGDESTNQQIWIKSLNQQTKFQKRHSFWAFFRCWAVFFGDFSVMGALSTDLGIFWDWWDSHGFIWQLGRVWWFFSLNLGHFMWSITESHIKLCRGPFFWS